MAKFRGWNNFRLEFIELQDDILEDEKRWIFKRIFSWFSVDDWSMV